MKWQKVNLSAVVNNLDSRRKPLNDQERAKITVRGLYPYIGANNIMGYVDEYLFDETILCVAEDGGSWGAGQKCAVIYSGKTWVNNHAHVLTASKRLDIRYLKYFLNYADLTKHISGSTRGKLTKSSLENIEIPLPPLHIQEQIADTLDKADALRKKYEEQLENYDEFVRAVFYETFGYPNMWFEKWDKFKVKDVCKKVTDGEHGTVKRTESGRLYLMARNIRDNFIDLDDVSYISEKDHMRIFKRCNPEEGDLLLVCVGATIGRVSLVPKMEDFSLARSVALLKPNRDILEPAFLYAQFKSDHMQKQIALNGNSSAQAGLYTGKISDLDIFLPPLEIQRKFSAILSQVKKMNDNIKDCKLKSALLYDYLLSDYFS